jgi:serine phosphatase RsbU (regulator of sigma subunit)
LDILDRFAKTLDAQDSATLRHVRDYIEWQAGRVNDFAPGSNDDVALRTFLLQLKMRGASRAQQREQMAALRRFYDWAVAGGRLATSPFDSFSVERPFLTRDQVRRREEVFSGTAEERQIARLQALNQLAERLNRSLDMQTTLTVALETLVSLLNLRTAWAFLLPAAQSPLHSAATPPPHDFVLAATCGLPPGLEREDCHYLRQPQDCHCQFLLREGQLKRAVNIVECTRLQDSAEANGDNQGLLFHASVPILASGQPLGIVNVATEEWQFLTAADLQLLSAIGAQVAIALGRAQLYDLTHAQRLRLERELQMAREVQASLLPQPLPKIPGFSLAADWRSALEMAGDFYDAFPLPDGRWAMVIADVSDKGAPAALYMAMTHSLIRASASVNAGPAATLREVNQRIHAHSSSGMFVTVFYAVLDAATGALTCANAGHNAPLLRRAAGKIEPLARTGLPLGLFEESSVADVKLTLEPGDVLVAYTDGLTEALNPKGEEYGLTRFTEAVIHAPLSDARLQLDYVSNDLAAHTQDVPPFDDITLFIIAREFDRGQSGPF